MASSRILARLGSGTLKKERRCHGSVQAAVFAVGSEFSQVNRESRARSKRLGHAAYFVRGSENNRIALTVSGFVDTVPLFPHWRDRWAADSTETPAREELETPAREEWA